MKKLCCKYKKKVLNNKPVEATRRSAKNINNNLLDRFPFCYCCNSFTKRLKSMWTGQACLEPTNHSITISALFLMLITKCVSEFDELLIIEIFNSIMPHLSENTYLEEIIV